MLKAASNFFNYSLYRQQANIPAIGFAPLNNIPLGAHETVEHISVATYFKGVDIYKAFITHLANI